MTWGNVFRVCLCACVCLYLSRVHDVRPEQVFYPCRHGGALVQQAPSPVAMNEACPLERRERCCDFPTVVALNGENEEDIEGARTI